MNKNEKFVITINRELGSGGRTVGRILAEKLGVPFYDKALIKALEEKYHLDTEEIERLKSRKRSWWADFKRVMTVGEDAAMGIAEEESCVIAGRSAFFILNAHPNHLSVLIQAPIEYRIERLMKKQKISWKDAMKTINKVDKMREEYVKNYANTSRYDSRNYDLVINMDGKTEEQVANLILSYID